MKIRCKLCSDVIESLHTHDFRLCSCKSIYIDGGKSYTRIGWPHGPKEDFIEVVEEPEE